MHGDGALGLAHCKAGATIPINAYDECKGRGQNANRDNLGEEFQVSFLSPLPW